jgi:hypothetical protein
METRELKRATPMHRVYSGLFFAEIGIRKSLKNGRRVCPQTAFLKSLRRHLGALYQVGRDSTIARLSADGARLIAVSHFADMLEPMWRRLVGWVHSALRDRRFRHLERIRFWAIDAPTSSDALLSPPPAANARRQHSPAGQLSCVPSGAPAKRSSVRRG